jgi:quinol monooxygenase YgiN
MLVVNRFAVGADEAESFAREAAVALEALAACAGYVRGGLGRAVDDERAWMLWTEWSGVGAYRRALSSYDVKMCTPLLGRALPEPSGYEVLTECGPGGRAELRDSDREDAR